jgi:hypothetical protein
VTEKVWEDELVAEDTKPTATTAAPVPSKPVSAASASSAASEAGPQKVGFCCKLVVQLKFIGFSSNRLIICTVGFCPVNISRYLEGVRKT